MSLDGSGPLWPNEATSKAIGNAIADCEEIAQRAANEAFGDLVGVAEDAIAALNDLMRQVENTIDEEDAEPTGEVDRG